MCSYASDILLYCLFRAYISQACSRCLEEENQVRDNNKAKDLYPDQPALPNKSIIGIPSGMITKKLLTPTF